ncbi:Tartrate-resistant acid phosphatase type 5 [Planctomycetales bacterium 10988]|nr:Tartrate-resistant acid phosphatase type 5 [Planctomycetales bacterium 10988]
MSMNRRRALKTLFCYSSALALSPQLSFADASTPSDALNFLAIGDYGTTGTDQRAVAAAMETFCQSSAVSPDGLLLLGDNFYSPAKDGFSIHSERWRTTFEDVYRNDAFPCPCWAVLGNHDYRDNLGGEVVQMEYAKAMQTRWRMPNKWYRFELGGRKPLATVLALDSNFPSTLIPNPRKPPRTMSAEETQLQLEWLEAELSKPRAPLTIVMGHHPVYSNGQHGDTPALVKHWAPLFEKHQVHAYLCGHDHDLQHLELEGLFTSYVLSGGGGARTRRMPSDREIPYGKDIHGFTHLQIVPEKLIISHHSVDGQLVHRFTKSVDGTVTIG